MKVVGVTFVRNAIKYDFPIVEAIRSLLPACDEVWVGLGKSEDDTHSLIQNIDSPKIKILNTIWDDSLRKGGKVLAVETNKVLDAVPKDADWLFYLQGDEVFHEKDVQTLRSSMEKHLHNPQVEGLLFRYKHFYGSYHYLATSRQWYRQEIRVIRNNPKIRSYQDAQGFRLDDRKLQVKWSGAEIFHYGHVKPPTKKVEKKKDFSKLWHDEEWVKKELAHLEEYPYDYFGPMKKFEETHPSVMSKRIAAMDWPFTPPPVKLSAKDRFTTWFEQLTGKRIGEYRNFKLIR